MGAGLTKLRNQSNVALHHAGLGFGRHPAQSEFERHWAKVHAGALRETSVLSMLYHAETHASRSGQNLAHHAIFQDWTAIVSNAHCSCGLEGGIVVECLAFRSPRSCRNRKYT